MTTILGPVAGAFPLNEGWHMKGQTPRKPQIGKDFGDDLRRLSDLTIHEITVHHSTSTATTPTSSASSRCKLATSTGPS